MIIVTSQDRLSTGILGVNSIMQVIPLPSLGEEKKPTHEIFVNSILFGTFGTSETAAGVIEEVKTKIAPNFKLRHKCWRRATVHCASRYRIRGRHMGKQTKKATPVLAAQERQISKDELIDNIVDAMFSTFVLSTTRDTGVASHA